MRTIVCDRCGTVLAKGEKPAGVQIVNEYGTPFDIFQEWDFCPKCIEEIKTFCQSKPVQAKKVTMDKGKVRALRKAGWSIMEIAKEMGCSSSTISKVLSEKEGKADENHS